MNFVGLCLLIIEKDLDERIKSGELRILPRYEEFEAGPNGEAGKRIKLIAIDIVAAKQAGMA